MSFPYDNPYWREAGEYIASAVRPGERILAPDAFWSMVSRVQRYVPENLVVERGYDWVVLDTNDMRQIPRRFLEHVTGTMTPVFVNRAFVIWSADPDVDPAPDLLSRLAPFAAELAQLPAEPVEANRYERDPALADAPTLVRLADVDDAELRSAMNDFYRRTGYLYPTRRDAGYYEDIHRHLSRALTRWAGGRVLDVCSGGLRFVELSPASTLVRTDLAEVGVGMARDADGAPVGVTYAVVDAHRIACPDASFDGALFVDSIEHVRDAGLVFAELARVLKTNGELLVTFANRDSLNQVITRKLGYPEFVTNHQHIREFTLGEVRDLLGAAGFDIVETAGVSLYPYWGVPGIDRLVRHLIDDDSEVVEMLRELGARAGAEYAYVGVVLARTRC